MTELAYLPDLPSAYVRQFTGRVVALPPGGVVLDRTYFYPTGGGQPSDQGSLRTEGGQPLAVVDVIRSGSSVVHRLRGPNSALRDLKVGGVVEGTVDWSRRHRHMRLHTAQHLVSALVFAHTGLRTERANLSGSSATIDLEGAMPGERAEGLPAWVGAALEVPRRVAIRLVSRAEWDRHPSSARSGLVPLPATVDPVRVIEIEGLDVCPCGGTHVRSTGEIGPLEFPPEAPRPSGKTRVRFLLSGVDPPTPSG